MDSRKFVEDLRERDEKDAEDGKDTGKGWRRKPRVLLTHIPLWREEGTECGIEREHSRPIYQGEGKNYQNELDKATSEWLLRSLGPNVVFRQVQWLFILVPFCIEIDSSMTYTDIILVFAVEMIMCGSEFDIDPSMTYIDIVFVCRIIVKSPTSRRRIPRHPLLLWYQNSPSNHYLWPWGLIDLDTHFSPSFPHYHPPSTLAPMPPSLVFFPPRSISGYLFTHPHSYLLLFLLHYPNYSEEEKEEGRRVYQHIPITIRDHFLERFLKVLI